MLTILQKLNLKEQKQIFILNSPPEFDVMINQTDNEVKIMRSIDPNAKIEFFIGFATNLSQLDQIAQQVTPKLFADAIMWICYPKASSKKYKCDFNRDTGWQALGKYNIEPVRQIAIDENWSALRFRKVEFIKRMSRNSKMTISQAGKDKINSYELLKKNSKN
jgi:hypothetical protein